uniref:Uncharacterized protein n=1 Tax=Arundo donax TaxID=35708 RepID=A0A0A9FF09_ARUDO
MDTPIRKILKTRIHQYVEYCHGPRSSPWPNKAGRPKITLRVD